MATKKKQCSGTKGYSCGRSCISVKKVCRKDGLAGQSVKILNNFVKEIKAITPKQVAPNKPSLDEIKKMKVIGAGHFGTVYSDGKGKAYKIESLMTDFDKLHPVIKKNLEAIGIKDAPDLNAGLIAKQNSMKIQNELADAGFAPKAFDAWIDGNNLISTQEELIGYKTFNSIPKDSRNKEQAKKIKEFMRINGIKHSDLHIGNIMQNSKTKKLQLIDLDWASKKGGGKSLSPKESEMDWKWSGVKI